MRTEPFVIDVSVTFDLNDFQYFMYFLYLGSVMYYFIPTVSCMY